jgi:hypothetical protein
VFYIGVSDDTQVNRLINDAHQEVDLTIDERGKIARENEELEVNLLS